IWRKLEKEAIQLTGLEALTKLDLTLKTYKHQAAYKLKQSNSVKKEGKQNLDQLCKTLLE
ncbi:4368_t:CDS:2, partial [Scutellospora calospora]